MCCVFGGRIFVDLDYAKPLMIFLCLEGLSVCVFSVAVSSTEPS